MTFCVIIMKAIIMFFLSITIYEIFANEIKYHKSDLEHEGQGQEREKRDLCYSTGDV